jgi:hypothetical protein
MVSLRGRPRTRREPLARVGRLDQVAGVQLVEACLLDQLRPAASMPNPVTS